MRKIDDRSSATVEAEEAEEPEDFSSLACPLPNTIGIALLQVPPCTATSTSPNVRFHISAGTQTRVHRREPFRALLRTTRILLRSPNTKLRSASFA